MKAKFTCRKLLFLAIILVGGIHLLNAQTVTVTCSAIDEGQYSGHGFSNLTDGNLLTSYYYFKQWIPFNVTFAYSSPVIWNSYSISTDGATHPSVNDPKNWIIQVSDNGSDWTNIDTHSSYSFTQKTDVFNFTNSTSYLYYRWMITGITDQSTYLAEFTFSSQTPTPTSSFTYVSTGRSVAFTNTSTNATSYSWDFGDGNSSTSASPTHVYATPGTYTVALSSTGTGGTVSSSQSITVSSLTPTSAFTYNASGLSVAFTNTSSNATSYSWDFGDGTAASTTTSPSHIFASAGNYTVTLTATSADGSTASTPQSITVAATPTANYTYTANDLSVAFTNTSSNATSYSWDFGDGTAASTSTSPSHTFASAGSYTVVLTATNSGGSNQKSTLIAVSVAAPVSETILLDFGTTATSGNWNNITASAANTTATLINNSGASTGYTFTITTAFGGPSNTGTGSPTTPASTIFPVTATQDFFYCTVNGVFTLTGLDVNTFYTFDVFASRAGLTAPLDNREGKYTVAGLTSGNASLDATNNTGNYVTISNIKPDVTGKITFTVSKGTNNTNGSNYFYLNALRITSSATSSAPPTASYTYSANGLSVAFTNTSTNATSYSWDFGDGTAASTAVSPTHVYATEGNHTVVLTATNANGSNTSSNSINVVAGTPPTAAFTYLVTNKTVRFTNHSVNATSYSWNFGDGSAVSTATSPTYTFASAGNYTVELTATNTNGSVSTSKSISITVLPNGGETKRILFLGNSYVFTTNPYNIPQILERVATSVGDAVVQQSVVGAGWSLQQHAANVPSLDAIRQGNWDYVSMNEYSHKAAFPPSVFATETFPYAQTLNDTINKYNPWGETIFYQSWGYKQGDDTYCQYDAGVCTYEQMDDRAQANYMSIGLSLDAIVNPVAAVRRIIKNKYPNSNPLTTFSPINPGELYTDSYGHPTAAASYISACCFYTTMFRKDPTLITYDYPESTDGSLTQTIAADIRATVKAVIYDNMINWYIGKYDLRSDYFRSTSSGNWNSTSTWQSSTDGSNWITATTAPTALAAAVTIQNGHTVTVDANTTTASLTLNSGSVLTVNPGKQFTVSTTFVNNGTLNLNSDGTNGTGTIITPATISGTGTVNVQQYLTSGRNWYVSSPVTAATSGVITTSGNSLWSYDELNTGNVLWNSITATDASLNAMQGYVVNKQTDGVFTFTGTSLNNGNKAIVLNRTENGKASRGFNLVGNPYPSYLDWAQASLNSSNIGTTMWYRTKSPGYVFAAYNRSGGASTNGATQYIAPMQAFWVYVKPAIDLSTTTGTLAVTNIMRSHETGTNRLKVQSSKDETQKLLRLQVSDGTYADEAVVYFDPNASNDFDDYDSPKKANGNPVPDIYSLTDNQGLAINGFNKLNLNQQVTLGLKTGNSKLYTIKATEIKNFDSTTRIVLKDNFLNTEFDLTDGGSYDLSPEISLSDTSRFKIIFKSQSIVTEINSVNDLNNVQVYQNANHQITIKINDNSQASYSVIICNSLGIMIEDKVLTNSTTVLSKSYSSGVYFAVVSSKGKSVVKKIVIQ